MHLKKRCHRKYVKYCRLFGVYIPKKDADWEVEPEEEEEMAADLSYDFHLHYQTYDNCDAEEFVAPEGRQHDDKKNTASDWFLCRCQLCGGSAIHRRCGDVLSVDMQSVHRCQVKNKMTTVSSGK
jgi:hypothetical protein